MIKQNNNNQIPLFDIQRAENIQPTAPIEPITKTNKLLDGTGETVPSGRNKTGVAPPANSGTRKVKSSGTKPLPPTRVSLPIPAGDVRLTANIRQELHLRLKIAAATRRTTIGELIEELVETYL